MRIDTSPLPRAPLAALVIALLLAIPLTSGVRAQTSGGDEIIPTVCGPGVLTACGTEDIMTCERTFVIDFSLLMREGRIGYWKTNCTKTGERTLYKDQKGGLPICTQPTSGTNPLLPSETDGEAPESC